MSSENLLKGFRRLINNMHHMTVRESPRGPYYDRSDWLPWAISCKVLIGNVFGEFSPFYIVFDEEMQEYSDSKERVRLLENIFINAYEAFEGGYATNTEISVSGEVFGDFVALAKEALERGQKDVAAVLASAALEDSLKRYAKLNGLEVDNKSMAEVINALKSKGLLSGASRVLLEVMPSIRNHAQHARWDKIDEAAASGIINAVEQFLLAKFSP